MAVILGRGPGLVLGLMLAAWVAGGAPSGAQTTTRGEVDLQQRIPTEPAATLQGEAALVSEPEAEAEAPVVETFSFKLNGLNITRATVYDADDFAGLYEEFIGTEVTLGNLREIADRIETKYNENGYLATRAIIPPQAIADGVPTIEVYEGQVIYYEINGEIGPVKKQIARLLDNLITGEPARWSELERYLLLARDLPGISLTGTLRAAGDTAPGGVVLVVDTARKAVDGFINAQNLSAEPTGPDTVSGGIAANSNTEFGERVGAVVLSTVRQPLEQLSGFLSYQQSLGNDGVLFKAWVTRTYSEPGAGLKAAGIETNSLLMNFQLEYPLVRSRDFSLWSRGGFEYIDQYSFSGDNEIFDDQVRVLFAGLHGVWRPWGGGLTQFDIEARKGVEDFGAARVSVGRSRPDAAPDFLNIRGSVEHLQPLGSIFAVNVRGVGQYSKKPLTSIEEMGLGDLTVGRGFEAGSVTGESGFGIATEFRISTPDFVNETTGKYIDRVELYGFFDAARVYDRDSNFDSKYQGVTSVGFGVRVQAFQTLYADFYYAIPLEKGLEIEDHAPHNSLFFNITKFF